MSKALEIEETIAQYRDKLDRLLNSSAQESLKRDMEKVPETPGGTSDLISSVPSRTISFTYFDNTFASFSVFSTL